MIRYKLLDYIIVFKPCEIKSCKTSEVKDGCFSEKPLVESSDKSQLSFYLNSGKHWPFYFKELHHRKPLIFSWKCYYVFIIPCRQGTMLSGSLDLSVLDLSTGS